MKTGRRQLLKGIAALGLLRPSRARAGGVTGPFALRGVTPELDLAFEGVEAPVRLAGVYLPAGQGAVALLRETLAGGAFLADGGFVDRWGRRVALVEDARGASVQAALLGAGLALVDPTFGPVGPGWPAAERRARAGGGGLWRDPGRVLRPAADAWPLVGAFGIVRGVPVRAKARSVFTYVDFAADWRDGCSLRAETKAARAFLKAGLDLGALPGRSIEARGWAFRAGGPMIEVVVPGQIEVVA
ncbi:MAG: hypothetical protein KDG89_15705 [Geminicoccaceae bacterium]|nr:hypothetical protein [Geminicoccaceae bacterium]